MFVELRTKTTTPTCTKTTIYQGVINSNDVTNQAGKATRATTIDNYRKF